MENIRAFTEISLNRDIAGAREFQRNLQKQIIIDKSACRTKSVCGFDISYNRQSNSIYAAAIVLSFPDLDLLEQIQLIEKTAFPYVPGLLAFREGLPIINLFNRLSSDPDLLIFDGHGLAHPRGMGIATMMGILLNKRSIGSAKNRLIGIYNEPAQAKGSVSELIHDGKIIGNVLRSRAGVKPIFVSIGHRISLKYATSTILKCCNKYRLPEPVRLAHILSNQIRVEIGK